MSSRPVLYVCLLIRASLAPAAGPCAGQDSSTTAQTLRTTIIKPNRPTVGLSSPPSNTFKPIQTPTTYEAIPAGGPDAHSEFSYPLCKKE